MDAGAREPLLEICVETLAAAEAAAEGGADRIELCAALDSGGVTPSLGLLEIVLSRVRIPVHCMIRPRSGDFCYSSGELRSMERDIALAKAAGTAGVVLGVLTSSGHVDRDTTLRLIAAARPMRVTFHRAFDAALRAGSAPQTALDDVIAAGVDILLTSGGAAQAADALDTLAAFRMHAHGRVEVMAGSGVRACNAAEIWQKTGVAALHASLRRQAVGTAAGHLLPGDSPGYGLQKDDVSALAAVVRGCRSHSTPRLT